MTFTLTWPAPHIALRRFHGHLQSHELARSFEAVMSDWQFDGLRLNVADLTEVKSVDVGDRTIELLAAMAYGASITNRHMDVLIVAPHGPCRDLVDRYMRASLAPYRVHLSGSRDEANTWLAQHHAGVRFLADGSLEVEQRSRRHPASPPGPELDG